MAAPVFTDGRRTAGGLQEQRWRPLPKPYPASAAGSRKRKGAEREAEPPCGRFAGRHRAQRQASRCGAPTDGWGHRTAEAVRTRHVSARKARADLLTAGAMRARHASARKPRPASSAALQSRHVSCCGRPFLPKPPLPRCIGVRVWEKQTKK